jgi:hypothetical protein
MSHLQTRDAESGISDADISRMLQAFSGPPEPVPSAGNRRHRTTRRSLVPVAVAVLVLGVLVPGSLALVGAFSETPQQFISDVNQPLNARRVIERYIDQGQLSTHQTLTDVQRVVTAPTPEGEFGVYALGFSSGQKGIALISSATGGVGALGWGIQPCSTGWALEAGPSMVERPGKTPAYFTGLAARAVTSIDVVYSDGHSTPAALSNGYFLAWVDPAAASGSTSATLVARGSGGTELGHLNINASGEVPPALGQAPDAPSCG